MPHHDTALRSGGVASLDPLGLLRPGAQLAEITEAHAQMASHYFAYGIVSTQSTCA